MGARQKLLRLIVTLVGAALVGGGVVSVFLIEWKAEPPPEPKPIRPIKTIVVGEAEVAPDRAYPGKVKANEEVDLAFQVAGPLIEFPVSQGLTVEQGELLARIDPRDFRNALDAKIAAALQRKLDVERYQEAERVGAATQKEVDDAKAAYDMAEAERKIAEKALDDTYMRAPFPGLVARTFVENYQNVQAKQPILRLQDVTHVDIEVNIPEERAAFARGRRGQSQFIATFEYAPDLAFNVTIKEFATEADPATQTYAVTLTMPSPEDITILPGMTATVRERQIEQAPAETVGHMLPLTAVPVDGVGVYHVWLVRKGEGDTYSVHRVDVEVGEMRDGDILVMGGVSTGDRIASAGVNFLDEGQEVRLLGEEVQRDAK